MGTPPRDPWARLLGTPPHENASPRARLPTRPRARLHTGPLARLPTGTPPQATTGAPPHSPRAQGTPRDQPPRARRTKDEKQQTCLRTCVHTTPRDHGHASPRARLPTGTPPHGTTGTPPHGHASSQACAHTTRFTTRGSVFKKAPPKRTWSRKCVHATLFETGARCTLENV